MTKATLDFDLGNSSGKGDHISIHYMGDGIRALKAVAEDGTEHTLVMLEDQWQRLLETA